MGTDEIEVVAATVAIRARPWMWVSAPTYPGEIVRELLEAARDGHERGLVDLADVRPVSRARQLPGKDGDRGGGTTSSR